ncbi:cytochrome P450 [Naematelia encephala]|uniref:Cytochrome P450 n=1 Tax=Naematelia encephala TaxID=71784 RepID=A0A1Y2BJG3_9TREE|nr:cytochrome P450 [Naematelia encephala]
MEQLNEHLTRSNIYALVGLLAATYFGNWILGYIHVHWQVRGLPKIHSGIEYFESGLRGQLPHIPFIVPVKQYTLDKPWKKYADVGCDLIALTQVTTSYPVYISSNPAVAQQISQAPMRFNKAVHDFRYRALDIFGKQIVSTSSGPEHKRHKAVVRGCFGEEVMENAWNKIVDALQIMLREEGVEDGGVLKGVRDVMVKTTLLVFGKSGFGIDIPWHIPHTNGSILPFPEALHSVEDSLAAQLLLPQWFMTYSPSSYLRRCAKAQRSLVFHIKQMIASRQAKLTAEHAALDKNEKVKPPTDLLGALVASQIDVQRDQGMEKGLSESEIVGNIFIFSIAGHETTAYNLTWALAFLALYPDVQEKLYEEVNSVTGGELPTYRDVKALPLCLATIYEALRLRDIVMTLTKVATEDTLLPYTKWDPSSPTPSTVTHHTHTIKKGSYIVTDTPAAELNPFFWTDPHKFDPTRHLGEPQGPFVGFSMGTRQCIGKRFAEVEQVAFISHFVKHFKILLIQQPGETWEMTKERMLHATQELTYTPANFDLKLEKRI